MTLEERTALTEQQIRTALDDYWKHVDVDMDSDGVEREDVSDAFIERLARDSVRAKRDLRALFRKSPAWNEELDALVINGNRTHDADADLVYELVREILRPAREHLDLQSRVTLNGAALWFPNMVKGRDNAYCRECIEALAPGAYAPGKKPSRVLKALCVALGVADETAGSEFQKKFARVADEMNGKKIDFKLFVSLNPAHFLTMSNPKYDVRGRILTSCHSFNSTEYEYNNGCSGYARDKVSFIAFTVDDPGNAEELNNRKTSRQVFAYRPGNGVLLQSRMYKKCGGVYDRDPDSDLYRDLIQREICALEDCPNLWKTYSSTGDMRGYVDTGCGFGGYADWKYDDFDGRICIRQDGKNPKKTMEVGTYGLCIDCGDETDEGLRCEECRHPGEDRCAECGDWVDEDEMWEVHDSNGYLIWVCEDCRDASYTQCAECGEWVHDDDVYWFGDTPLCRNCYDECVSCCETCGEEYWANDLQEVEIDGVGRFVCPECAARWNAEKEEQEHAQIA